MSQPTATTSDLTWTAPDGIFKYRVAAIVYHDGDLLLCGMDQLDYTFLPGGKVKMGESTVQALSRELHEELGRDIRIGPLTLVVENLYQGDELNHEICFYYQVPWPADLSANVVNDGREAGHCFTWKPFTSLDSTPFQPAVLVPYLVTPNEGVHHIVLDRR